MHNIKKKSYCIIKLQKVSYGIENVTCTIRYLKGEKNSTCIICKNILHWTLFPIGNLNNYLLRVISTVINAAIDHLILSIVLSAQMNQTDT